MPPKAVTDELMSLRREGCIEAATEASHTGSLRFQAPKGSGSEDRTEQSLRKLRGHVLQDP